MIQVHFDCLQQNRTPDVCNAFMNPQEMGKIPSIILEGKHAVLDIHKVIQ